ncbi:hypothetical protein VCR3J2_310238 [Vibrio coralliirubri]|nr:hypothetical protein VCR3J2_310238 [Vibrio coralliirubri]
MQYCPSGNRLLFDAAQPSDVHTYPDSFSAALLQRGLGFKME